MALSNSMEIFRSLFPVEPKSGTKSATLLKWTEEAWYNGTADPR